MGSLIASIEWWSDRAMQAKVWVMPSAAVTVQ
jgi:hypothetical protein